MTQTLNKEDLIRYGLEESDMPEIWAKFDLFKKESSMTSEAMRISELKELNEETENELEKLNERSNGLTYENER